MGACFHSLLLPLKVEGRKVRWSSVVVYRIENDNSVDLY